MMSPVDAVRDWVGSTPDDATILNLLSLNRGDPHKAALSVLRRRYADLTSGPARWAVTDDYSEDNTATIKMLENQIGRLEALVGDSTDPAGFRSTRIAGPDLTQR